MKRVRAEPYTSPTVIGVDVSHWQGLIEWPRVARSTARFEGTDVGPVRYAIVRTGDGKDTDRAAVLNLTEAHEAGLLTATYHYIRAKHGAAVNLEVIRDVLRVARVPTGFVALDVEGVAPNAAKHREGTGAWLDCDTAAVLGCVREMGAELEAAGHRVVVYTGQSWHYHIAQAGLGSFAERWPGWLAYYTRSDRPRVPAYPAGRPVWDWSLWQFAGSKSLPGSVAGITGAVDLNRWRGDEDALREWWDHVPASS